MRRVLKIAAYRRLLAAYTLNELAFMVGSVALALLVFRRTGSALGATAFFLFSQFVPALIAPMVVARVDQRRAGLVLPILYWFEGVVFLVLAWLASRHAAVVPVLALALLDGIAALTARSLARAATVSVTTSAGLLREGNAIANAAFSVCFMAGPVLGGAVVAAGGTSAALLADSALFAVIGLTLATAGGLPEPGQVRSSARGRVRAALGYVRNRPLVRDLLLLQCAALLFFTISIPVEVVFAQHTLQAGAAGYGGLLSAWGAGAVGGSAIYARWRRLPSRELIALGAFALGVGFLVLAAAPTLAVAIIGGACAGVGNGVEAVAARTALQEETEEHWMALMMSLNESILQSVPGAGILLGGALTALGSPRLAFAVAGVGSLVITAGTWVVLAPRRARPDALGERDGWEGPDRGGARHPDPGGSGDPDPDGAAGSGSRGRPATPAGRHQ